MMHYFRMMTFIKYWLLCTIWIGYPFNIGVCDTSIACMCYVGIYFTECDSLVEHSSIKEKLMKRYAYMYLLDLKLPRWLVSNLLYFGTGLTEFLI